MVERRAARRLEREQRVELVAQPLQLGLVMAWQAPGAASRARSTRLDGGTDPERVADLLEREPGELAQRHHARRPGVEALDFEREVDPEDLSRAGVSSPASPSASTEMARDRCRAWPPRRARVIDQDPAHEQPATPRKCRVAEARALLPASSRNFVDDGGGLESMAVRSRRIAPRDLAQLRVERAKRPVEAAPSPAPQASSSAVMSFDAGKCRPWRPAGRILPQRAGRRVERAAHGTESTRARGCGLEVVGKSTDRSRRA